MTETPHNSAAADHTDAIIARVTEAAQASEALYISGGGSKRDLFGRTCLAPVLDVSGHRGIIDYAPGELVVTARAGTPLQEVEDVLASEGQVLAFEPPLFGGRATLGGTLACNLSGPARPWRGSMRDAVLGVQLINGGGECLEFGGRVMKNVAGYDVSRLQSGAQGSLGVLGRVSLKTLPAPEHSITLRYAMGAGEALETMNRRAGEPKPLSGACWLDGQLFLRLCGAASAVQQTARLWGGDPVIAQDAPWRELREMSLPFFDGPAPLWRITCKPTAHCDADPGAVLMDWAGAQRWLRGDYSRDAMDTLARQSGGHATLVRGGDRHGEVRGSLPEIEQALQKRLKQAFDPCGILNPGRLYSWL